MKLYTKPYVIVAIALLSGIIAGVASGYYTGKTYTREIVTIDIKKLAEEKRIELIKRFQTDKPDENTARDLEKEYSDFLKNLDLILDAYLKNHKNTVLLRKEAVIDGQYADITEAVRDRAKKEGWYFYDATKKNQQKDQQKTQ